MGCVLGCRAAKSIFPADCIPSSIGSLACCECRQAAIASSNSFSASLRKASGLGWVAMSDETTTCVAVMCPFNSSMRLRKVRSSCSIFIFSSSPSSGVGGGEKLPLSAYRGLTRSRFHTHRHQFRRTCPGGLLPVTCNAHGKVRAAWCDGAVGVFSFRHGRSFSAHRCVVTHQKNIGVVA